MCIFLKSNMFETYKIIKNTSKNVWAYHFWYVCALLLILSVWICFRFWLYFDIYWGSSLSWTRSMCTRGDGVYSWHLPAKLQVGSFKFCSVPLCWRNLAVLCHSCFWLSFKKREHRCVPSSAASDAGTISDTLWCWSQKQDSISFYWWSSRSKASSESYSA